MKKQIAVFLLVVLGLFIGWRIPAKADSPSGFALSIAQGGTTLGATNRLNCDGITMNCLVLGATTTLSTIGGGSSGGAAGQNLVFTAPPIASMWTQVGRAPTTLNDIMGGGLSFSAGFNAQVPGGFQIATPALTFTFAVQMPWVGSDNAGVVGIFCDDVLGNAVLWHWGFNATSISYWSGMTNGGSPSFGSTHANTAVPIMPQFARIRVTAMDRFFEYSTDGVNWLSYSNDPINGGGAVCVNAGVEGYGDGSQLPSFSTLVSVQNSNP